MKDKKSSQLASYTSLMEDSLSFMCSIEETFFLTKVVDKQLGLKLVVSFTNMGPDIYIYIYIYIIAEILSYLIS